MRARITFEVECPEQCTGEEFRSWIEYEMGINQNINPLNPLAGESIYVSTAKDKPAEITIEY